MLRNNPEKHEIHANSGRWGPVKILFTRACADQNRFSPSRSIKMHTYTSTKSDSKTQPTTSGCLWIVFLPRCIQIVVKKCRNEEIILLLWSMNRIVGYFQIADDAKHMFNVWISPRGIWSNEPMESYKLKFDINSYPHCFDYLSNPRIHSIYPVYPCF